MTLVDPLEAQGAAFKRALAQFDARTPPLVLAHNDADGLSAAAIFHHLFARQERPARVRLLGRGENPWAEPVRTELSRTVAGGLIVADLGVRAGRVMEGTPTILVDHHVPAGTPEGATVISGHGLEPTPTSSLLAYRCAAACVPVDDLLWLAALGIVGDLGERAPFAELAEAKKRYRAKTLREAVSLTNAPRRAAAGDAQPAFDLLVRAQQPAEIVSGEHPETAVLQGAREEVKAALEAGKRTAPLIGGKVALIRLHSPCQIHPLVAQAWRFRLKGMIVIAANTGYRPGWVHFAVRSATGTDLIAFLRDHAPSDRDEQYGSGHKEATGGALRPQAWAEFLGNLGFEPQAMEAA